MKKLHKYDVEAAFFRKNGAPDYLESSVPRREGLIQDDSDDDVENKKEVD